MASDFAHVREQMVDCQIRTSDVTDPNVISAFLTVPREEFLPEQSKALAYCDSPLQTGDRMLMAAASMAKLLQAAEIKDTDVVLDIGCGSGYSAAVISRMCQFVVALESDRELGNIASDNLARLEYDNSVVVEGPLADGYPTEGPFDVIFLGGSIEELPDGLLAQLRPGGRLIAVEGSGNAAVAKIWINNDTNISARPLHNCAIPPLAGFAKKPSFIF
ncbi:MAG: protein-L-isoaspartate O-methyltransferase family protein [Rhizobiaceae bacterium]